jgi:GntR family transcriptional regulator
MLEPVDPSAAAAKHDQVAAELRREIAEGEIGPGERFPPARYLAAVLCVNRHTVMRALHTLRDEGLVEIRQGRGVHVCGTPQRSAVTTRARELLRFARQQGYATDELIAMIQDLG